MKYSALHLRFLRPPASIGREAALQPEGAEWIMKYVYYVHVHNGDLWIDLTFW